MSSGRSNELSSPECVTSIDNESQNSSPESEEEMEDVEAPVPEEVGNLAKDVFGNHLIRKKILNFAIHEANGKKILRGTIASLRLVQKSWLKTIAKLFNKNGDLLYQLVLDGDNSLNESVHVQQNRKILDRFVDSVAGVNSSIHHFIPTFSLYIRPSFFREENRNSLYNCLRLCGAQLLEVKMEAPINGGSLPGMFPGSLSLGRMKKFTANFTGTAVANMENWEPVFAHDSNAAFVIHSFLLGATALTEFQVPSNRWVTQAPLGFQFLPLPITLTKIDIQCELVSSQMKLLANSELPHLTDLRFLVSNREYENEMLFRIFDNCRLTLRSLYINGILNNPPIRNTHMYRFPFMENLETFYTSSIHTGLLPTLPPLETCLPNLCNLTLRDQAVAAFQNWTESSKFSSVVTLHVSLANGNSSYQNRENYIHNLEHEQMQRLHITFPNVTYLEITTSATATHASGFKYLFREMTQLITLAFIVGATTSAVGSDVFWDALLIGFDDDLQLAAGLRASPAKWAIIDINNDRIPSIRMLTKLRCLKLCDKLAEPVPRDTSKLLISDMAFHYALLKMKNLTTLVLQGRFLASDVITEKWRELGKTLVHYPPPANV